MRFFSSSALARAPKLRFAASCSAAETIFGFLPRPTDAGHQFGARLPKNPPSGKPDRPHRRAMTQMLRSFAFVLFRRQDFHRAASLLDRRDGGFRRTMNLDRQLGLDLTTA